VVVASAVPPDIRDAQAEWENSGRLITARPAAVLCGLVDEYRGFRDHAPALASVQRELPGAVVPLILELGAGWHIGTPTDNYRVQRVRSFVAGMHDSFALVGAAGPVQGVQVDLLPIGARRVLGVPMHELTNRCVPLDALLGRAARELTERLANAGSWPQRVALLDAAFTQILSGPYVASPEMEWVWRCLERTAGRMPIRQLCLELGWSRKRFVARFRENIGLGPKTAARVLRFQHLRRRLRSNGLRDGWADLAFESGYADQGHLAREVRRLAGITPTALLAETFIQDT